MSFAETGATPYYAVIFTSVRTEVDDGYTETDRILCELAEQQPGYLGVEWARNEVGITVSYWRDLESIAAWKANATHRLGQQQGREKWYEEYVTRICKVERDYSFKKA